MSTPVTEEQKQDLATGTASNVMDGIAADLLSIK